LERKALIEKKNMKEIAGLLILALQGWCVTLQAAPNIGDVAPFSPTTELLEAPPGSKLDAKSLGGKIVILEFWATWCGPCVAAIPHLNELAEQFTDKPVQFVAVTAEPETTVKAFIQKRPIKAWLALDTDKAMNKAYGVVGIPHAVIIDKKGRIVAVTHPTVLTSQLIEDLLAGKKVSLAQQRDDDTGQAGVSQARPLFELTVRPSLSTNSTGFGGGGQFTAHGYTVLDLLPRAFDQVYNSTARIVVETPLPKGRYDFTVIQTAVPGRDSTLLEKNVTALLQQLLSSAFGLIGHKETREVEVLLLRIAQPGAPGLVVSPTPGGASRAGPGVIEGTDMSVETVAMAVEKALNLPVFDETGLTNRYDISLKWEASLDKPNPDGLRRVLRERLGLEAVLSRRQVGVVVIEQTTQ
jgi:uncharacterized protein (TIGR03435 family)